ncbi:TonB-dependent receptor [Massilia sp. YIM B02769]|uniref:TonB-dependent receptor n=1 Tax=Massilia sp. YIM B02769 TaxID=3050129 RepID=UPI0025B6E99E|nr:TonB-dependent receptor [Massilia sp. YIM B02769]MDN4059525.1 TonB-dependent receptor [Massilia sp. YIM B02769]
MHYPLAKQKLISLAVAAACGAFLAPAYAQEAGQATATTASGNATGANTGANADQASGAGNGATTDQASGASPNSGVVADATAAPQVVLVKGIRQSMASSMNMKRNATGFVDGIVAEDIGKFPDTNLAESLQRISGVSIDREIGEGSKVTVRGVGPDLNLVLLNGRQMPTSNLGDRNGRAYDFANIASEAISQIQVYKSARADSPTGGIGATLNVMTARPLERNGQQASIGVKGVYDTSADNLPDDVKRGKKVTPEISGIYSTASADGKFGIAISGSYQERNLGYNRAAVPGGWRGPIAAGDNGAWGNIPQPGTPGSENIVNRPSGDTIYSVPQNLNYSMSGVQRERTNGQLVLQYAPSKALTTTLDYTYSENKIHTRRQDMSAWFNFGPSASSWGNPVGGVAPPLTYIEIINPATSDIAMGGADFATRTQNKSLGFNAVWKPTNALRLELDAHKSTAESMPDSPWGSSNTLGTASFSRGTTTADFTQDFPVLSIVGADFANAGQQVTGSTFQNAYMKGEVEQLQLKGGLKVMESSELNFGLALTEVNNRSAFSNQQRETWGGATSAADYPSSVWHQESLRQYFDNIKGSNNPNLFNTFYTFDFGQVRQIASDVSGNPALYLPKTTYDTDQRTRERSKSLYLQFNTDWDFGLPVHTGIGVRYENTDVLSSALVPIATAYSWESNNEFKVRFGAPNFTSLTGKYHYFLPTLDADVDLRPDMKLRFAYGETIGRPRWDEIAGGQVLVELGRVIGGDGSQGNPALKPVHSKNTDLSYEWYYGKQSFFAIGHFRKNLKNYSGQSRFTAQPFNLHTPVGGAFWNEAIANGCISSDTTCIRNYIFRNKAGQPGVIQNGVDGSGNPRGEIIGQPGDPIANFQISTYANQKKAMVYGTELNVQHMFGNTGFGVQANYTFVDSGLRFDNGSLGDQFVMPGLSDSANLVGIYENNKWTVRAALNWRDEFLSSRFDDAGPNPIYQEAYKQLDLSIGYAFNDRLTIQFEAINLTDETQRSHGRTKNQVLYATQSGPRYMLGARYKF